MNPCCRPPTALAPAVTAATPALIAATALAVLATATAARAQDEPAGPVLQWRASAGLERDSNVLRALQATADEAAVLAAGLHLDKRWSLQRLTLDAEARRWHYRDFANLDYRTLAYEAAWNFRVTPRLEGVLSAQRRQYRDITDATPGAGSVFRRTERDELAQATWLGAGGWRALAGLSRRSSRSDDPRALESSPRVDSARLGGGYEFASGARVLAWLRRGDGHYEDRVAPDFRETEPTVSLHWPATEGTTLDLRVGRLRRAHDAEPGRDFEGTVGSLEAGWRYSPKTRVDLGLARDLGSYEFAGGGHVRGWRAHVSPTWHATAKLTLRLRLARETRAWQVAAAASPDAGRDDRLRQASLGLDWDVMRALRVSASVRREWRDSSLPSHDFRARLVSLAARLAF